MDGIGYLKKADPGMAADIIAMQKWIAIKIKSGMTIPEVVWAFISTFYTALDSVRFNLVPKDYPEDEKRRRKWLKKIGII